jgi:hypothetical protein
MAQHPAGATASPDATIRQSSAHVRDVAQRRRSAARSVAVAAASTSTIYLAASAAGVGFTLTDPGKSQAVHLTLPAITGVTLFFALLGWAALAVLEHCSPRARAIWIALAGAVLLLSFVPIGIENATTATKTMLALIHTTVAVALLPMLGRSRTT